MKIISIVNQKGGVAKSTTACSLAKQLSILGHKVLVIDLDPQCNTSYTMHAAIDGATVYGILSRESQAGRAIQHAALDILAASHNLTKFDKEAGDISLGYRLREGLTDVVDKYDYAIVDTPPSLGMLLVNALTASDYAIVPCQADLYSLQGIAQLAETIATVKKYSNRDLTILGILLTRYTDKTRANRAMKKLFAETSIKLGAPIFKSEIRESTVVKEAQSILQTVVEYKPDSPVSQDYIALTDEILSRITGGVK